MVAEPKYVSTRVGIGTQTYISGVGGPHLVATPITESSFSMVEPNVLSSGGGNRRYWMYTATADGAVRVDVLLSMPGPNAHLYGTVRADVYHFTVTSPTSYETSLLNLHTDEGFTTTYVQWGLPATQLGSGSFVVEEGEVYLIQVQTLYTSGSPAYWGPVVRLSSLRPAEPTWYQPPDRVVSTYVNDPAWLNHSPVNPWDALIGQRGSGPYSGNNWRVGIGGDFQWNRSFHGYDPIYEIGGELAVDIPWQHAISGEDVDYYAAPGFNGEIQGLPSPPGWTGPYWGGVGSVQAGQDWTYEESGLGIFYYMHSRVRARGTFHAVSLTWERWAVGPRVGYTDAEFAAIAGTTLSQVVGFILEDDRPEILAVSVTADWDGVALSTPAPVQWWVGRTRLFSDLIEEPTVDPPVDGLGFGPAWTVVDAVGADPPFTYVNFQGVVEAGPNMRPHDYLIETGSVRIGTYNAGDGIPVYVVPTAVWKEALELEETIWVEAESESAGLIANYPENWLPLGLGFIAGTQELLSESPVGAGLSVPTLNGAASAKGLNQVWVWPKINYRPSRFKVVFAPDIEIPLLPITGANPDSRQHFEPIPPS